MSDPVPSLDEATDRYAAGDTTLRQLATLWGCSPAAAYEALYGRPMPPPAQPPCTGARQWHRRRKTK